MPQMIAQPPDALLENVSKVLCFKVQKALPLITHTVFSVNTVLWRRGAEAYAFRPFGTMKNHFSW